MSHRKALRHMWSVDAFAYKFLCVVLVETRLKREQATMAKQHSPPAAQRLFEALPVLMSA